MRAGTKSTFVEIQRETETRSQTTNAVVRAWTKIGEAWVAYEAMQQSSENYTGDGREEQRVVRLYGDYLELADVRTDDRLVDVDNGGAIFDVKANLPDRNMRGQCILEVTQGPGAR